MLQRSSSILQVTTRLPRIHSINGRFLWITSHRYSSSDGDSGAHSKSKIRSRLLLTLFGTTALTAGTLAYAKNDQDFRNFLKDYVPWTDDTIAIMFGERETPVSWVISSTSELFSSASNMIFGSSKETNLPKVESLKPVPKKKDVLPFEAPKTKSQSLAISPPPPPPLLPPSENEIISTSKIIEKVEEIKPVILEKVYIEDEKAIENAGYEVVTAYKRAIEILKKYSKKIDIVLDNSFNELDFHSLEELRKTTINKEDIETNIHLAVKNLDEVLAGGDGPIAQKVRKDVNNVKKKYDEINSAISLSSRYWDRVEQARRYFIEELEAMYPNIDISAQKLNLNNGSPDGLLLLALRKVLFYQQLLAHQETILTNRVENALKDNDYNKIQALVNIALEKERRELALLYQKKDMLAQIESKKELEKEINKQINIHVAHLKESLDNQAKKLIKEEKDKAGELVEGQRISDELKMAAILGRLQGVDDALKARSNADKLGQQSKKLWTACQALDLVLRKDVSNPIQLSKELENIEAVVSNSDELVNTVLHSLPSTIRERGVFSEVALREKYHKVEKVCRQMALVPEDGANLPVQFLSWLQSVFIIKETGIPKDELQDKITNFSKLDTFEILQRVRYWVERSNWVQALQYANLLKGAPGVLIRDWANEVALHLETRQAAKVLLTYAAANGYFHL